MSWLCLREPAEVPGRKCSPIQDGEGHCRNNLAHAVAAIDGTDGLGMSRGFLRRSRERCHASRRTKARNSLSQ